MATDGKMSVNTDAGLIESGLCEVTVGEINFFLHPAGDDRAPLSCYRTGKGLETASIDDEGVWVQTPAGRRIVHRWS